jgi:hypothetical protein
LTNFPKNDGAVVTGADVVLTYSASTGMIVFELVFIRDVRSVQLPFRCLGVLAPTES